MRWRRIAVGMALPAVLAGLVWLARTSRGGEPTRSPGSVPTEPPSAPPGLRAAAPQAPLYDGGPIARTIADRAVRDDLRRRILAAWAAAADAQPPASSGGASTLIPMPTRPDGNVDPAYIQSVIREDMLPMARACYEELLSRQPDAGGRVEMSFSIVADEHLGGIVDDVATDGGLPDAIRDERMDTCMRESLSTLAFRPPPQGGTVTIVYPIVFSPREER
jgi:hypothetical protein